MSAVRLALSQLGAALGASPEQAEARGRAWVVASGGSVPPPGDAWAPRHRVLLGEALARLMAGASPAEVGAYVGRHWRHLRLVGDER